MWKVTSYNDFIALSTQCSICFALPLVIVTRGASMSYLNDNYEPSLGPASAQTKRCRQRGVSHLSLSPVILAFIVINRFDVVIAFTVVTESNLDVKERDLTRT